MKRITFIIINLIMLFLFASCDKLFPGKNETEVTTKIPLDQMESEIKKRVFCN